MNDAEKKELLAKDIEELESIKTVKLQENEQIILGHEKLQKTYKEAKEKTCTINDTLLKIETKLKNREDDEITWNDRINALKLDYDKMVEKKATMNKELDGINNDIVEKNGELKKIEEEINKKDKDKFIIGRMREVLLVMFEEMRPVYERAGAEFPYGSVDEVLSGLINKKDEK